MKERNLTGIYFPVRRGERKYSIDFTDMTMDEQIEALKDYDNESLIRMCVMLARNIRDIGDSFDIAAE